MRKVKQKYEATSRRMAVRRDKKHTKIRTMKNRLSGRINIRRERNASTPEFNLC